MKSFLKPKKSRQVESDSDQVQDPDNLPLPQSAADYLRRGYAYYSRSHYPQAIDDFQAAISREPDMVDAVFALGMALKAANQGDEGTRAFQQVLALLNAGAVADRIRADMLRRLAIGHINEIASGDWNLKQEIWHREE
jgi:tetratricopeptide (TPR) repeat protein